MNRYRESLKFLMLAAFALLAVFFQNCIGSSQGPSSTSGLPSVAQPPPTTGNLNGGGGNGEGYDKVYVHIAPSQQLCPDGSVIDSKIKLGQQGAILVRDACQDLASPQAITVTVDPANSSRLTYLDRVYVEVLTTVQAATKDAQGNRYILGGATTVVSNTNFNYLAKLDANGTVLWSKEIQHSSDWLDFNKLAVSSTGDIYLSGNVSGAAAAPGLGSLVKLDSSGTLVWSKQLQMIESVNGNAVSDVAGIWDLQADSAGNLYLAADYYAADMTNSALVLKLDSTGAVVWSKSIAGNKLLQVLSDQSYSFFSRIAFGATGQIYVSGWIKGTGAVLAISIDGNTSWSKQFSDLSLAGATTSEGLPLPLTATADAGVLFGGGLPPNAQTSIIKLGSDGSLAWAMRNPIGSKFFFSGFTETSSGLIAITGNMVVATTPAPTDQYGIIAGLSSKGIVQWSTQFKRGTESSMAWLAPMSDASGAIQAFAATPTELTYVDPLGNTQHRMTGAVISIDQSGNAPNCQACAAVTPISFTDISSYFGTTMGGGPALQAAGPTPSGTTAEAPTLTDHPLTLISY